MNFKPGDFFFGIVDFFAFIAPGAILFMTWPYIVPDLPVTFLEPRADEPAAVYWSFFILVSYILGHFIHHISALLLNPFYELIYFKRKRKKHIAFIDSAEEQIRQISLQHADLERVADAYIRLHQPMMAAEREKHEANSKLFRSLALLCLYLCFYPGNSWLHIVLLVIASFLSLLRFANQRWRRLLRTYELFCVIHAR